MSAYFPLDFHKDFIDVLANNRNIFNVITYDDFLWDFNENDRVNYPKEYSNWSKKIRENSTYRDKIHILIQHDVDNFPERTMRLIEYEMSKNIKTNIMIFNKKVSRPNSANEQMHIVNYDLNFDLLKKCEENNFVIGYHCNAYERAQYDLKVAQDIFKKDIEALNQKFRIRYFSAHGGTWSVDKKLNNVDIVVPKKFKNQLNWVHNGSSPFFEKNYSDGGLSTYNHLRQNRDLRLFIKSLKLGRRYRVLTHPQYYSNSWTENKLLAQQKWYKIVLNSYNQKKNENVWSEVDLYIKSLSLNDNPGSFKHKFKKNFRTLSYLKYEFLRKIKNQINNLRSVQKIKKKFLKHLTSSAKLNRPNVIDKKF